MTINAENLTVANVVQQIVKPDFASAGRWRSLNWLDGPCDLLAALGRWLRHEEWANDDYEYENLLDQIKRVVVAARAAKHASETALAVIGAGGGADAQRVAAIRDVVAAEVATYDRIANALWAVYLSVAQIGRQGRSARAAWEEIEAAGKSGRYNVRLA